jgi:hypothetical protein
MPHRVPAPVRTACAGLLCLALAPLVAACDSSSSAPAPAASSATAASRGPAPAKTGGSTASASAASRFSATCPTAAAVSAAVGRPYPVPTSRASAGEVLCTYESSSVNLVVTITPAAGVSVATLKAAMAIDAQVETAKVTPVAGLGEAAFVISQTGSGGASTTVGAMSSSIYVIVVSSPAVAPAADVARLVLAE